MPSKPTLHPWLTLALLATALLLTPLLAAAQSTPPRPANEQVIVPEVERREVRLPRIPSKDLIAGLFAGIYSTDSFGASPVVGLRLGYHLTEDFFFEAAYGRTRVSDESFRQILPGGVFSSEKSTLSYYNVSLGYNILPGEVFLGAKRAKATVTYLIAGIGSTELDDQRNQTLNIGLGTRFLLGQRSAVQLDLRDHIFSFDLLGERRSTHNLELTLGLSFFF
ncbi:MAG: outer membrane beta-barrel domain-containing protein [Caldimonas sp.]|uniref:outer membrane beta-barrel domain-containing protein n=1 Tax=Caldimonas sp. TaxID=2838790 RepID=UPI00391DD1B3